MERSADAKNDDDVSSSFSFRDVRYTPVDIEVDSESFYDTPLSPSLKMKSQ